MIPSARTLFWVPLNRSRPNAILRGLLGLHINDFAFILRGVNCMTNTGHDIARTDAFPKPEECRRSLCIELLPDCWRRQPISVPVLLEVIETAYGEKVDLHIDHDYCGLPETAHVAVAAYQTFGVPAPLSSRDTGM